MDMGRATGTSICPAHDQEGHRAGRWAGWVVLSVQAPEVKVQSKGDTGSYHLAWRLGWRAMLRFAAGALRLHEHMQSTGWRAGHGLGGDAGTAERRRPLSVWL